MRQANLAPQLRDRAATSSTPSAASGDNVANRSPDDIRNALSAMQRGWQQARADQEGGPGQDGPPANGAHAANGSFPAGPDEGTVPGDERLVTDEERVSAEEMSGGGTGGHGYSDGYGSGYGTADRYGVGNVGYPDYAAEPGLLRVRRQSGRNGPRPGFRFHPRVPDGRDGAHRRQRRRHCARRGSGGQQEPRRTGLSRGKR